MSFAGIALWSGLGNFVGAIMLTALGIVWRFLSEIFTDMTGLRMLTITGNLPHVAYLSVVRNAYGLKQSYRANKCVYRQGMFIDVKNRYMGTLNISDSGSNTENPRFTMYVWSFADVTPVIYERVKGVVPMQTVDRMHSHITLMVDVPKPIDWQSQLADYIQSVYKTRTNSGGLVVLITGPPGCGKSTFPFIFVDSMILVTLYKANTLNTMYMQYVLTDNKSVLVIDEADIELVPRKNAADFNRHYISKAVFNDMMDIHHVSKNAGLIVMTSNRSFEEICTAVTPYNAESMFRPGRIDIIVNITYDLKLEFVRKYVQVANVAPQPRPAPTPEQIAAEKEKAAAEEAAMQAAEDSINASLRSINEAEEESS